MDRGHPRKAGTPVLVRVPRLGCAPRLPLAGPACPQVTNVSAAAKIRCACQLPRRVKLLRDL